MSYSKTLRRILTAMLTLVMALSLAVPAFAAETGSNLEEIANLYADWDGSYELPDLDELTPEDQEIVKALVDAIMRARDAETETQPEIETTQVETIQDEVALTISFSDVPTTHTFYKGIMYCAGKGIVNGYADGTFQPAKTVAKSHFCAMLARGFYADQIAKYDKDQYKNAYGTFAPTNMTLAYNGTLNNTSFRWNYDNASVMSTGINRYDMAQLMTNIMKAKGFAASASQKTAIQAKITDYKNIPSQYQDAVKNVYALGIISGYSDGRFVGTNIMNRGQAAIVIQRMAQYAPVTGDKDNDQFDDGTSQKPTPTPDPKPVEPTPKPEPTPDPRPEIPETPETPAGRTLANGKAITESNVTEILNQLQAKYPRKTDFSKGYAGLGSGRSPSKNCIAKVIDDYRVASGQRISTATGCAGWAAFVADEIWGQTGVTWRKTTIANARPGDLMIKLDDAGNAMHVFIYVGEVNGTPKTVEAYSTDAVPVSGVYKVNWGNKTTAPIDGTIDVYTAYPD